MKKILALALAAICVLAVITVGYVYIGSKHDRSTVARSSQKDKVAVATSQSNKTLKVTSKTANHLKQF